MTVNRGVWYYIKQRNPAVFKIIYVVFDKTRFHLNKEATIISSKLISEPKSESSEIQD